MTAFTRTKILELTTIKKGASAASLTMTRYSDGQIEFLDADGKLVIVPNSTDDAMKRLIEAIDALV